MGGSLGQGSELGLQDQADVGSAQLHHFHAVCDSGLVSQSSYEMTGTNYVTQTAIS